MVLHPRGEDDRERHDQRADRVAATPRTLRHDHVHAHASAPVDRYRSILKSPHDPPTTTPRRRTGLGVDHRPVALGCTADGDRLRRRRRPRLSRSSASSPRSPTTPRSPAAKRSTSPRCTKDTCNWTQAKPAPRRSTPSTPIPPSQATPAQTQARSLSQSLAASPQSCSASSGCTPSRSPRTQARHPAGRETVSRIPPPRAHSRLPVAAEPGFDLIVLVRLAILGAALGPLVGYDLRERRVPNRIVLPATVACAALTLTDGLRRAA